MTNPASTPATPAATASLVQPLHTASSAPVLGALAVAPPTTAAATAVVPSPFKARHAKQDYNPLPHVLPEGDNAAPLEVMGRTASTDDKLVIVMVGLPATGKTHIAKRICRFLSFFHDIPSQIFNVGDYRRQLCGAQLPAHFYSPENQDGMQQRQKACDAALSDLLAYLNEEGIRVAALDATNSTKARRQHIVAVLKAQQPKLNIKCIVVESICDDKAILRENIHKVKLSTPDYKGMEESEAVDDFLERRANYESYYEPVDEDEQIPFCKIVNSVKYVIHNIRGYISLKVVHFVMNLHTLPRTFYLTRHGQSEYNLLGKIGGDSGLTPAGVEYARRLAQFAKEEIARPRPDDEKPWRPRSSSRDTIETTTNAAEAAVAAATAPDSMGTSDAAEGTTTDGSAAARRSRSHSRELFDDLVENTTHPVEQERPCRLWTSTMRRTQETAQFIAHGAFKHTFDNGDCFDWSQFRQKARRNLDELYAGTCDGMTYKEIQEVYPEEFERRQADKLSYRYPRGESYMDVTLRLEPLAQEMERVREPLLIVGHQGILRILYAYFMGLDRKDAPYVSIPLNNVIQLTPHAYGCHETRYCLMMKEEMLVDGQDEPVTSMPMGQHGGTGTPTTTTTPPVPPPHGHGDGDGGVAGVSYYIPQPPITTTSSADGSNLSTTTGGLTNTNRPFLPLVRQLSIGKEVSAEDIDADDPIMNAPSC